MLFLVNFCVEWIDSICIVMYSDCNQLIARQHKQRMDGQMEGVKCSSALKVTKEKHDGEELSFLLGLPLEQLPLCTCGVHPN